MAGIRQTGVHGERSRIAEMIAGLEHPRHPDAVKVALHALAQLGAVEALPLIEYSIRTEPPDSDYRNYTIAARARLVAENSAAALTDPTMREGAKISRLLKETGFIADQLNEAARNFRANGGHSNDSAQPLAIYVMREVADIAYREHHTSSSQIPGAQGIDFSLDPASALKIQLAPMAQYGRAAWLVNDIAHFTQHTEAEGFECQLAVDEGLPASRIAALILRDMQKNPTTYPFKGIADLSDVMMGIGDRTQLPLLEQLSHDPNPRIAEGWRLTYSRIFYGKRETLEVAY